MSEISLYNILHKKPGEQETIELVAFVKAEITAEMEAKTSMFMTKEDKLDLVDRINKAKTETIIWIVGISLLQFMLTPRGPANKQSTALPLSPFETPVQNLATSRSHNLVTAERAATRFWIASKART